MINGLSKWIHGELGKNMFKHTMRMLCMSISARWVFAGQTAVLIFNEAFVFLHQKILIWPGVGSNIRVNNATVKQWFICKCKLEKISPYTVFFFFYYHTLIAVPNIMWRSFLNPLSHFMIQTWPQMFPKGLYTCTVRQVIGVKSFFSFYSKI